MSKLLVGAAKVCINPTPDMYPVPTSAKDWGIACKPQTCVYDDMDCRAIAIDNGTDKLLLLNYDLSGIPTIPELGSILAEATGIAEENIIISATHNHTGVKDRVGGDLSSGDPAEVEFAEKYKKIEIERGIEACQKAIASMRPAKYGYGESLSYINVNRDLLTPGGFWCEARNMEGYSDKTLAIIKFVDLEGNLIAAFMNHPTHATCCYQLNDFDGNPKTSGNFTGIAAKFVEEHYGNGAVAMWTSGAAGNQNPLLSHGMQYEYPDGYTSAIPYPDGVGYMQMEFMGRWHGSDCVKGIDEITEYTDAMPIKLVRKVVKLPAQKRVLKEGMKFPFRMGGHTLRDYNEIPYGQVPPVPDTDCLVPDPENPVDFRIKLLILGDIALVCTNAELYCEIGRDMKAASPLKKTVVVTHTDHRKAGYILDKTAAAKNEKVFQAFSMVIPGSADELIVDGMLEAFDEALAE